MTHLSAAFTADRLDGFQSFIGQMLGQAFVDLGRASEQGDANHMPDAVLPFVRAIN